MSIICGILKKNLDLLEVFIYGDYGVNRQIQDVGQR